MSSEPTSALTFSDLQIEVARKIGVAYYGSDGTGVAQPPADAHDLDEVKRHVNNGIRMFLADGPNPNGWFFSRPTASVTIWHDRAEDADKAVTAASYDSSADRTEITVGEDSFYETMENKSIVFETSGAFTVRTYVSPTKVKVEGDASGVVGEKWSMTADNAFTLPRDFGGEYIGSITYAADTNQGITIDWVDEAQIRLWLENITDETGDPFWAAVRPMATGVPRRRWELLVYPGPDEVLTVRFPYILSFDKLVEDDEVPPIPFSHDDTVKAACLAIAEKDVEGAPGPDWQYYRQAALPNSYRIDAMSRPKRLGYFGNPGSQGQPSIKEFRDNFYQRPRVSFNT